MPELQNGLRQCGVESSFPPVGGAKQGWLRLSVFRSVSRQFFLLLLTVLPPLVGFLQVS